jgi:hypothetical protein
MSAHPFRRRIATLVLALAAAGLIGCEKDDPNSPGSGPGPAIRHPQDFLPQQVGGMAQDGPARVATNVTDLQAIVDGGYQTYTLHGFRELAEQNYVGTLGGAQATLRARIFDQGNATSAAALHADENVNPGGCSAYNDVGDEARVCSGLVSQTLQFHRDAYWVELVIQNTSPDGRSVLDLCAQHVDGRIRAE